MTYTVLLIALPLLFAFLSIFIKKGKENLLYLGLLVNVLLLMVLKTGDYTIGGFDKPFGITLLLDQYSYIGVILINTLFLFSVIANYKQISKYATVLLTLLAGVNGMLLTNDLFNLFVFMEITTLSLYILNTNNKQYVATFNYIIISAVGSSIYLLGVILVYANFGHLNIAMVSENISAFNILPLILIFIGLSVEAKLFPINGWVKGIYSQANGLVSSIMASIVAAVSLLVLGRLIHGFMGEISTLILLVAVVTLILGEFAAFKSKTIKEILLYSSVGQSGLVTILMVSGLYFPAILVIINNSLAKLIMFTIADELTPHNQTFESIKGVFSNNRMMGVTFTIASFSLIGLPLFLGFYAKLNSLLVLAQTNLLVTGIILFITIVEGAYLIRLNIALWHPGNEGELVIRSQVKKRFVPNILIATVLLSAVIIASGLLPEVLGEKLTETPILNDSHEYLIDMKGGM